MDAAVMTSIDLRKSRTLGHSVRFQSPKEDFGMVTSTDFGQRLSNPKSTFEMGTSPMASLSRSKGFDLDSAQRRSLLDLNNLNDNDAYNNWSSNDIPDYLLEEGNDDDVLLEQAERRILDRHANEVRIIITYVVS